MRRPLLSLSILATLLIALILVIVSDTAARGTPHRIRELASGACSGPCSRCPAARSVQGTALLRHGNPAVVPHAFVL